MFIPRKRPKPMKKAYAERQVPGFRRWVKKLQCSVRGCPRVDIDPAHVRVDLPADALKGGTSLKPHDAWIIPLCRDHHNEQHRGEVTFSQIHNLDPVGLSQTLWAQWLKTSTGHSWLAKNPHHAPAAEHLSSSRISGATNNPSES